MYTLPNDPTNLALEVMKLAQPICARIAQRDGRLADRLRSALLRIYLDVVSGGVPKTRAERFRRTAALVTEISAAAGAIEDACALAVLPGAEADRLLALLDRLDSAFRASVIDRAS